MFEFGTNGMAKTEDINGMTYLRFPVDMHDRNRVREAVIGMKASQGYTVSVKQFSKKRSLDANALFWMLATRLAAVLKTTKEEVYRQFVKEIDGAYEIVQVREDAVEAWCKKWGLRGTGWVAEDLGASRNADGDHRVMCHFGSSTFDQRQMSQLIDLVMDECKEQGISTLNELEIESLLKSWGAKND